MSKKASKAKSIKAPSKRAKQAPAPVVTTAAPKAVKAPQQERIVQNGVKRPLEGGACAAVWAVLDQMREAGVEPASKDVRDLATARGWNENNALCELSAWRKFNGLTRQVKNLTPKRKTVAKTAAPAVLTEAAAS
jgi:hypothetical protein